MGNRGYSLVEILTVIIIMLVLTGIAFLAYNNIGLENKETLNKSVTKKILEATAAYCSNPVNDCENKTTIQVKDLRNEGLLDGELMDYVMENPISDCAVVGITPVGAEGYNFEYEFDITLETNFNPCP